MSKYTSIGGQALIEGIMMKNPQKKTALAVRKPDKTIDISYISQKSIKDKVAIFRLPVLRGVVTYIETMVQGYSVMMKSADISGYTELEESKEQSSKKESALSGVITGLASVLGILLAVGLFWFLPNGIVDGITWLVKLKVENFAFSSFATAAITQTIKILILVAYMFAISFMKDIRRTFMYHGAEHKTIFCFEKGLPLTVENVRKQKRFHPRCGTSFMILMILISVIISTLVQIIFPKVYDLAFWWILIKIALIPLICGIGFEVLKICGKYDNIITKIISAPGLWLQRINTKEPDDGMIEIAIAALEACKTEKNENDNI